ncbi:MAG TPA: prolyl oligopeptidase family serine peptidase [Candidatus Binatia bacterium]|nr:prolyl oligopeptidase family serine peptidase [Candidatus Binatia bacterium]
MRPLLIFIAILLTGCLTTDSTMPRQTQTAQQFKKRVTREMAANYLLFLPADYKANSKDRWPLMLFLHGAGERGTNLTAVTRHGPPKVVKTNANFPFILVSPQCPTGERWSNETLLALLDDIIRKHRVDTNRIYLTGLSMGGYGTWSLSTAHPEKFAAIAPICGGGDTISILLADGKRKDQLKRLPIWAFHGGKDPVVNVEESEKMVAAYKRIGNRNVELTIYPEAGHDSWTETYNNPKLYEWFLSHRLR